MKSSNNTPTTQLCTISSHYLKFFLAFSLVVLCTSEALVPSPITSSSFLPRAVWGTRGGSEMSKSSSSNSNRKNTLNCVLQVPRTANKASSGDNDDSFSSGGNNQRKNLSSRSASANGYNNGVSINGSNGFKINGAAKKNGNSVATAPQKQNGHSTSEFADDHIAASYIAETKLPTDVGHFQLRAYRTKQGSNTHVGTEPCVIYCADKSPFGVNGELKTNVPVRIHDQCLTSEVFRSQRCVCVHCVDLSGGYLFCVLPIIYFFVDSGSKSSDEF